MALVVHRGPRVFVNDTDISELVHAVDIRGHVNEVMMTTLTLFAVPDITKTDEGMVLRFRTADRPVEFRPVRAITVREDP